MPPNAIDGNDLERGKRFAKICDTLFPGVANVEIGRILAGAKGEDEPTESYSEGTIRRWKNGGPIGATALLNLQKMGVSLQHILEGQESQTSPAKKAGDSEITKLFSSLMEAHKALAILAESVASGEIDSDVAQNAVAEALKIVWQAHGKQAKVGKNRNSKADTHNTGTA